MPGGLLPFALGAAVLLCATGLTISWREVNYRSPRHHRRLSGLAVYLAIGVAIGIWFLTDGFFLRVPTPRPEAITVTDPRASLFWLLGFVILLLALAGFWPILVPWCMAVPGFSLEAILLIGAVLLFAAIVAWTITDLCVSAGIRQWRRLRGPPDTPPRRP